MLKLCPPPFGLLTETQTDAVRSSGRAALRLLTTSRESHFPTETNAITRMEVTNTTYDSEYSVCLFLTFVNLQATSADASVPSNVVLRSHVRLKPNQRGVFNHQWGF